MGRKSRCTGHRFFQSSAKHHLCGKVFYYGREFLANMNRHGNGALRQQLSPRKTKVSSSTDIDTEDDDTSMRNPESGEQ